MCKGYAAAQYAYDNQLPIEDKPPKCPECGRESDTFYRQGNRIIGCDSCIKSVDAWEVRQ